MSDTIENKTLLPTPRIDAAAITIPSLGKWENTNYGKAEIVDADIAREVEQDLIFERARNAQLAEDRDSWRDRCTEEAKTQRLQAEILRLTELAKTAATELSKVLAELDAHDLEDACRASGGDEASLVADAQNGHLESVRREITWKDKCWQMQERCWRAQEERNTVMSHAAAMAKHLTDEQEPFKSLSDAGLAEIASCTRHQQRDRAIAAACLERRKIIAAWQTARASIDQAQNKTTQTHEKN